MSDINTDLTADLLQVIANDKDVIPYRPELNVLTSGNVVATILLQQMIYWWYKNGRQKFYKFKCRPSKPNKLYKDGDSWCEELGINRRAFDTAIKKIGFKMGKARNSVSKDKAYIWYYTDNDRITWYILNEDLLYKSLNVIYTVKSKPNVTNINHEPNVTKVPETTTETTTETTKDISASYDATPDQENSFNHNKGNTPLKEIIEMYNSICTTMPKVQKITEGRRRVVRSRWLEYGSLDTFRTLFKKAAASDFLSGRSGRWTGCNFDWLMKPSNAVKVLEGCYDNKANARGMAEPTSSESWAEEKRIVKEYFGGDINEYGFWISAGKPPIDEWRRRRESQAD